jgi:hypothetical protein
MASQPASQRLRLQCCFNIRLQHTMLLHVSSKPNALVTTQCRSNSKLPASVALLTLLQVCNHACLQHTI